MVWRTAVEEALVWIAGSGLVDAGKNGKGEGRSVCYYSYCMVSHKGAVLLSVVGNT